MLKTELDRRRCFATEQRFKYNLTKHLNLYQHIQLCLEIMADRSNHKAQLHINKYCTGQTQKD